MANLITSAQGIDHVTSRQDAHWHRKLLGEDNWHNLNPDTIVTDHSEIQFDAFVGCLQGRFFDTEETTTLYADLTDDFGFYRRDAVCYRITNGATQSGDFVFIQGEQASSSNPPYPEILQGDLDAGDNQALLPLFYILAQYRSVEIDKVVNQYNGLVSAEISV